MYYFCTYFDQHYLDRGLALYQSLVRHCSPFKLWILCLDEMSFQILSEMNLPQIELISLSDFEKDDPELLNAKKNRTLIEYYFTCTPCLPLYILNHTPDVDIITYLDADLYFFSSIEPVFQEMGTGSILIIGHRFSPEIKEREVYGIYNVGLVSFRRNENGFPCLHWWRDRCLEWCYDRLENGKFADQKYLDDWPDRFSGVVVLQHKGAGLAPWNIANYNYSLKDGNLIVDKQPIIVYHFHGLKRVNKWIYDTNLYGYKAKLTEPVKTGIYFEYIKQLIKLRNSLDKKIKDENLNFSTRTDLVRDEPIQTKVLKNIKNFSKKIINKDLILI